MKKKPLGYVSSRLNLPEDIMNGACVVTAYGNRHVYIQNYKGIIEYGTDMIRLQGKKCRVTIRGCNLVIDYYTDSDMKIDGVISEVNLSD